MRRSGSPSGPLPRALLVAGLSLALTAAAGAALSTAGQRDQNRIVSEIRQIQVQLAALVEAQTALTEVVERLLAEREEQVSDDRRSRAETMNALDRMERNVATLSEAFRESNERLSALMVEVESVRDAQRRAALAGVPPVGGDPGAAAAEAGDTETPEDSTAGPDDAEGGEGDAGAPSDPGAPAGEDLSATGAVVLDEPSVSAIYMQADSDYLQGRYDLAFTGFGQVAESGGELADNARYLMGECRLAQDRLEDALDQFEAVIEDYPDSSKIGEAWYKKGLILGRMGHETDAREIFEDIVDVYAGTTAARLAQRELDALPPRDPGR